MEKTNNLSKVYSVDELIALGKSVYKLNTINRFAMNDEIIKKWAEHLYLSGIDVSKCDSVVSEFISGKHYFDTNVTLKDFMYAINSSEFTSSIAKLKLIDPKIDVYAWTDFFKGKYRANELDSVIIGVLSGKYEWISSHGITNITRHLHQEKKMKGNYFDRFKKQE